MTKIALSKPIKVELAGGRVVEQDYLEFSDITVDDSIKYLNSSLLGKKMELMDIIRGLYDNIPEDETGKEKEKRELEAGVKASKEFFNIFDDNDIINMVCALSKFSIKEIGQIPLFELTDMAGEILPFLLPFRIKDSKN